MPLKLKDSKISYVVTLNFDANRSLTGSADFSNNGLTGESPLGIGKKKKRKKSIEFSELFTFSGM